MVCSLACMRQKTLWNPNSSSRAKEKGLVEKYIIEWTTNMMRWLKLYNATPFDPSVLNNFVLYNNQPAQHFRSNETKPNQQLQQTKRKERRVEKNKDKNCCERSFSHIIIISFCLVTMFKGERTEKENFAVVAQQHELNSAARNHPIQSKERNPFRPLRKSTHGQPKSQATTYVPTFTTAALRCEIPYNGA